MTFIPGPRFRKDPRVALLDLDSSLIHPLETRSGRIQVGSGGLADDSDSDRMPADGVIFEHFGFTGTGPAHLAFWRRSVSRAIQEQAQRGIQFVWLTSWLAPQADPASLDAMSEMLGLADIVRRPGPGELPIAPVPYSISDATTHWKTAAVLRFASGGRGVLWVDDEATQEVAQAAGLHSGVSIIRPSTNTSGRGVLSDGDLRALHAWVSGRPLRRFNGQGDDSGLLGVPDA